MNIKRALGIGIGVSLGVYVIAELLLNGIFKFWYSARTMDTLMTLLLLGEIATCTDLILQKLDRLLGKTGGAPSGAAAAVEPGGQTTDAESK